MDIETLTRELVRDEGLELKPYKCTAGKTTIGIGRNLTDNGITVTEAYALAANDIRRIEGELDRALPWWRGLSDARMRALVNMAFNLGLPRLLGFRKMLAALQAGDFQEAARQALDSRWAEQVGKAPPGPTRPDGQRAWRIAELIRNG